MEQEQKKHRLEADTTDYEVIQANLRKIAAENEDVKSGKISIEDELKEPAYVLYGQILKSTTDILRTDQTRKLFDRLIQKFGEDTTADLMEFFSAAITQSSYNAVLFYNDLLKAELNAQFGGLGDAINRCIADVKAHNAALQVFRQRMEKLEGKSRVDEIKSDLKSDNPTE